MTHKKMLRSTTALAASAFALTVAMSLSMAARAEDAKPTASTPAPTANADAPPPGYYINGIRLGAQVEGGFYGNAASPSSGLNLGQSFTDRSNSVLLNQILLTVEKALDKTATDYDFGFKLQGMYGTDARYTHFLHELDRVASQRQQFDVVTAAFLAHTPWLTEGGIDFMVGQYVTLLGAETIDPSTNSFYSHSYIFNYGIPFKHTGISTVTHVTPLLDVYLSIDTGNQTSFGAGDNNSAVAGLVGLGSTLMDGNLTLLALSHFGPENPSRTVPNANGHYRYYNDFLMTYKANEKLTFITELNWIRDNYGPHTNGNNGADGYGGAQYVGYALTDTLTINGRGEIWRDQNNFFVGAFPNSLGPVQALGGRPPATVVGASKGTTYGAITVGFTYKPEVPSAITTLLIRPEVRYDNALSGGKPFNDGKDNGAFFFGADVVLGF